ncbi:MAG TPA: hypothetical protein VME22_27030, partial [Solirubrobacteraceae bacterium]|nr:hypothetical protein [Solirubrobacteraceae bacterium]
QTLGIVTTVRGDFAMASSLIAEAEAIAEATGTRLARYAAVLLAGLREDARIVVELGGGLRVA